jgi:RNA polymerase sigma-70 factor (ECF subfamily)
MPPIPMWFQGRDALMAALAASWDPAGPEYVGRFRVLPTRANGSPAAAGYTRRPGDAAYHAFAVGVLRIEHGVIAELTAFHDTSLFAAFGLPAELPAELPADPPPDR